MLAPIIIVLAAWVVLGLCWYGANGGTLPVSRSERQQWKRVAKQARSGQRAPASSPPVSSALRVERPAAEPWLTADELFQEAQAAADGDAAALSAEVDAMMGQLSRDRRAEP